MPSLEYLGFKFGLSVLGPVVKEVGGILKKEFVRFRKVDAKFKELQASYLQIEDMLAKLDCFLIKDTILESFSHDLDRYCYEIEDIVDDLILSLSTNQEDKKADKHPVRTHVFKHGKEATIPHRIGELQNKLKELGDLIEKLLSSGAINSAQPLAADGKPSPLSDKTSLISGTTRDRTKQAIISELTSPHRKFCGASIIGMDGLGKTSLARTILDDQGTKAHFPLVLSACVSGPFQLRDIVHKLVEDHSSRASPQAHPQPTELCQYHRILKDLLCNRKSLIILDDLWSLTSEDWDYFKSNYLSLCLGWKILTTTRNPKVAAVTGSRQFDLDRMTDEDCKKLIIHKANLSEDDSGSFSGYIELISKKCRGMPILANKIGLKLSMEERGAKKSMKQLKMESLWDMQEFKEVFPSLNLNEPKLPPDLKRCFAYCSLFPPTHEFNQESLIQLWEVEGFIQPLQTGNSKKHINQCFEDLLSRSILHPFKLRENKNQQVYKMHEFNHEYAYLLGSKAFCRLDEGMDNLPPYYRNLRHLSLACQNTDKKLLKMIEECEGLRTFLLLNLPKPKKRTISYNFFHNLQRLRLLDLSHTDIKHLPKPNFPSKHLRCLDLSYTLVTTLPESLATLRALQILRLEGCSELLKLPNGLNQLTNLTHLHVDMKVLGRPPSNIGKLTKLEVLDSFFVGKDEGCRVAELRNMEHLKKIHISGLENIQNIKEAEDAMLSEKLDLAELALEWDPTTIDGMVNAKDILKSLQPHNHLDDLILRNYHGQSFPEWLISQSCHLVSIYLDKCPNCPALPYLAELPFLKTLVLQTFHCVTSLDTMFCGSSKRVYPYLEFLEFKDMEALVSWTGLKVGDMPNLRALKIVNCPMLVNLPSFEHLSSLMSIEINNCPVLMSLPELPSSMNTDCGELVIIHSRLLTKRCKPVGADWTKIRDIPYVEIDGNPIPTKSSSYPQNEKDSNNMEHAGSSETIDNKNNTSQRQHPSVEEVCRRESDEGNQKVNGDSSSNQDPYSAEHTSSSGMNGNQNIGSQRQHPSGEACRRESDEDKQKVNGDSSSNRVSYEASLQQNGSNEYNYSEQTEDQHNQVPRSRSQNAPPTLGGETPNSLSKKQGATAKSTAANENIQIPSNSNDTQGHPRPSKPRSSSGFLGYLFGCFSKEHEEAPPSKSNLPKYTP